MFQPKHELQSCERNVHGKLSYFYRPLLLATLHFHGR